MTVYAATMHSTVCNVKNRDPADDQRKNEMKTSFDALAVTLYKR
jgi:hypothetical protein